MQVSRATLKETKVTMNPNDPRQQQPVAPPDPENKRRKVAPVPLWFSAAPAGMREKDFHHDRLHLPIAKWLKRSAVVLVAVAIIIGTGYGLISINKETDRLSTTAAAALAEAKADAAVNYRGDGSDILKTAEPQVIYECPSGFEKKSADSDECTKNVTTVLSGAKYSCETGQKQTGTGSETKCITRENPILKTAPVALVTSCNPGFIPSGNNCVMKETLVAQKQYTCPTGQVPSGTGDQTVCSVAPAALIVTCPLDGYSVSGSTCSKSTSALRNVSYPECAGYYTLSAPVGQCRRNASRTVESFCTATINGTLVGNTCVKYVNKPILRYTCPTYYTVSGSKCIRTVTQSAPITTCPAGWVTFREDTRTMYRCTYTISGTPVYGDCSLIGSGYVSSSATQCRKNTYPAPTRTVYFCELAGESSYDAGYGAGSGCYKNLTAIIRYSCSVGSLSGSNCIQTATPTYSCPAGYTQKGTGAGSACPNSSSPVSAPIVKLLCTTTDYALVGSTCEKTTTVVGTKVPGCTDTTFTYNAAESECTRIDGGKEITVSPQVDYECDPGFVSSGSGDDLTCSKQEVLSEMIQKILVCEDGWKKRTAADGTVDCVFVRIETTPVQ
jgi:hypothetical protein